jgi:CRP/FNR family transcriptional regulator, dissimilatory nitrate respiration regulator
MPQKSVIRRAAIASSLRRATIFNGLPEGDLSRISGYASVINLAKNELLFREGDEVIGFFVLIRGAIQAYRTSPDGKEQLIHLFNPGDSFAEPAIAGLPGYPASARALRESEVVLIPREPFLQHQREQSDLAWRMLSSLSRHLQSLVTAIDSFKSRDAETRLLHWILRHCPPGEESVEIELQVSKATLAAELGTRQETLSRIFSKLKKEGLLEVRGRMLTVRGPRRLRERFDQQLGSAPPR